MKVTAAEATELLKKLKDDYSVLLQKEKRSAFFKTAAGEDPEAVRPNYVFAETQARLSGIETRIRSIEHALNLFNATAVVPEFWLTVDEMLSLIRILNAKKEKLGAMRKALPKERTAGSGRSASAVEYVYANYDIEEAEAAYSEVCAKLMKAQLALNAVNCTVEVEL